MSRAAKSAVFAGEESEAEVRHAPRRAPPPPPPSREEPTLLPAPPSSLTPRPRVPRPRLPQESSDDDARLDDVTDDAPSPSDTPASPAEASRATPEEGEGPSASHPPPARATPTPPNDDDDAPAPTKNVAAAPDDVAPEADAVAPDDHDTPRPAHSPAPAVVPMTPLQRRLRRKAAHAAKDAFVKHAAGKELAATFMDGAGMALRETRASAQDTSDATRRLQANLWELAATGSTPWQRVPTSVRIPRDAYETHEALAERKIARASARAYQ